MRGIRALPKKGGSARGREGGKEVGEMEARSDGLWKKVKTKEGRDGGKEGRLKG